ncbi:hypothetical protein HK100_007855, partial [Physocladia obscura]
MNHSFATDAQVVASLLATADADKSARKQKYRSVKVVLYSLSCDKKNKEKIHDEKNHNYSNNDITIAAFNCPELSYKDETLPSMARGLFALVNPDPQTKKSILVRGYDKFFNIGEIPSTTVESIPESTVPPYEITVKENGCIIYVSAYNGVLIVTSKHAMTLPLAKNVAPVNTAIAAPPSKDLKISHAQKGNEWVDRHLLSVLKSRGELATFLERENVTAVFE